MSALIDPKQEYVIYMVIFDISAGASCTKLFVNGEDAGEFFYQKRKSLDKSYRVELWKQIGRPERIEMP